MEEKPVIYIFHGDDEYAMASFVASMIEKMGDPATAMMNTTHLDGKSFSLDSLVSVTHAMPFLAERRLVVLDDPLSEMKSPVVREKFKSVLESIPATTALVLVIRRPLVPTRERAKGAQHWLQKWAADQAGRVYFRAFMLPHGPQMARWIQNKAVELGGEFSYQAAELLADFVLDDPRLAAQEIQKLLAYVNYNRPVDPDDVETLTPSAGNANVFEMVDALGNRNGQVALQILHRLLEVDEPLLLFGMVVRQFRLLLLTRELVDDGYREAEIAQRLKTYPFVARKLVSQVGNFSMETLEAIYRRLLDVDEAVKTGKVAGEVALDILITSLTT